MANPSTVWAQLASPLSAIGSIPFVGLDGVTIGTDVANFFYTPVGASLSGTLLESQISLQNGVRFGYQNNSGSPGNGTINRVSGRVAIPLGSSSIIVTNSKVFSTSIILLQLETLDATLLRVIPTPANGQFTITGNAAATGNTTVAFVVINPGS